MLFIVALSISISLLAGKFDAADDLQLATGDDAISIVSVQPAGPVPAGQRVQFTFDLEVTLRSVNEATLSIGFNTADSVASRMAGRQQIKAGTHRVQISVDATPVDWGTVSAFGALIIIAPARTGVVGRFQPLASVFHPISVVVNPSERTTVSTAEFIRADTDDKIRMLAEIEKGRQTSSLDEVLAVVRAALPDQDVRVRLAAIHAVEGRALAWRRLQYPKDLKPDADPLNSRREVPPQERITDAAHLREVLNEPLVGLVRRDSDFEVRSEALRVLATLDRPVGVTAYSSEYVDLCLKVFASDNSGHVRSEVLQVLDYGSNDSEAIRTLFMKGFTDPESVVRQSALRALVPGRRREALLTYSDLRDLLQTLITNPAADLRLSAVRAYEALGASARDALTALERLASNDGDERVRRAAQKAVDTIRAPGH